MEPPAQAVAASPPADPATLPAIAGGAWRRLDPRAIEVDRITHGITSAVLLFGALIQLLIDLVAGPRRLLVTGPGAIALVALLVWWSTRWPAVVYRHTSYRVDELGIEIRRGVVWRRVINVPRSRVQHTDVSQGPVERSRGLGTLVIFTAGTEHAKVELSGLTHDMALRIRDHLLPHGGDDAV